MNKNQLSNNKTVKIPVWDETRFGLFSSKSKSVAAIKGFVEALKPGFASELPEKGNNVLTNSAKDKEKQKNKTMNLTVVPYLKLSSEVEEHLDFIKDARTDNWPSGLAYEI